MASKTIYLTNGIEIKSAPVGFSWTVFFFGGWPALFRQDWMWGVILILANIFTYCFAGLVFSFFYNKMYIKSLIDKGYKIKDMPGCTDDELKAYLGLVNLPKVDQ